MTIIPYRSLMTTINEVKSTTKVDTYKCVNHQSPACKCFIDLTLLDVSTLEQDGDFNPRCKVIYDYEEKGYEDKPKPIYDRATWLKPFEEDLYEYLIREECHLYTLLVIETKQTMERTLGRPLSVKLPSQSEYTEEIKKALMTLIQFKLVKLAFW